MDSDSLDPDIVVKQQLFDSYIRPFLIKHPTASFSYWLDQSFTGWVLGFCKKDGPLIEMIHKMCTTLLAEQPKKFSEVAAEILSMQHETNVRTRYAWVFTQNEENTTEENYSAKLKVYKVLFENEFRLWVTMPYFYLTRSDTTIVNHVAVGSSEKYHAIKNSRLSFVSADLQELILGFDNKIRNAGEGHDNWEVDDAGNLVLKITDPKSGEVKDEKVFTQEELDTLLKTARKTIWILETGFLTFIENQEGLNIKSSKVLKIKEIQESVSKFALERNLLLENFEYIKENNVLNLIIKYSPQRPVGTHRQILTAHASYDIIDKKVEIPYEYQMLDVVKMSLIKIGWENGTSVKVITKDESGEVLGEVKYTSKELLKLFEDGETRTTPIPTEGSVPDMTVEMIVPLRVPYGMREAYEPLIEDSKEVL